jgi:endothelial-specific receptor tyrosine kinase
MAPEALSSPQHAPKCEVWSFAVILWEIVTLGEFTFDAKRMGIQLIFLVGATPYVDVRAKEFVQRVQRGMRLKQPANIGVSLYQIMISCWQIDLDERPNFQELFDVLQSAFHQALDYLSFNLFPEFIYERYDPAIELNR